MSTTGAGTIFKVSTLERDQCVDISAQVDEIVARAGVENGFCHVMVLHSTAAIVVNENDDPNIGIDVIEALGRAIPKRGKWLHDQIDDNASAHIKAAILGPSELLPIAKGELVLGRWQGLMLMEFDGPRERQVAVHFMRGGDVV